MTGVTSFSKPPVVEVALSIQFESVRGLTTPAIGLLWQEFREAFPEVEEHPSLPPIQVEPDFPAPPSFEIQVQDGMPPRRFWFLSSSKNELIQIQQDRISHNWRKQSQTDQYPRYENVRDRLFEELRTVERHVAEVTRPLKPSCTELVYVDHIEVGTVPKGLGDLGALFRFWERGAGASVAIEQAGCTLRLPLLDDMGSRLGSIRLVVTPGFRREDMAPIFIMNTVVRAVVADSSVAGARDALDLSHRGAVRCFLELTTLELQARWE